MNETELYQYALFMLSRRDYGTAELSARMKRRMYEKNDGIIDEPLIERVIERLGEQHFLNDTRVIELQLRSYIRKGYGPLRIKQELRQKGFTATLIEQQFEQLDVDWFELATDVRCKNSAMKFLATLKKKQASPLFTVSRFFR